LVTFWFAAPNDGFSQAQYGPPNVAYNGQLLNYGYPSYGDVYGYTDYSQNPPAFVPVIEIDSSDNVWLYGQVNDPSGWLASYDPTDYVFTAGSGLGAVTANTLSFLTVQNNVTTSDIVVVTTSGTLLVAADSSNSWQPDAWYQNIDGNFVFEFLSVPQYDCFSFSEAPGWYYNSGNLLSIDTTSGWWPGLLYGLPPQQVYINGESYIQHTDTPSGGVGYYMEAITYINPNNQNQVLIDRYFNYNSSPQGSGDISGTVDNTTPLNGTFDPNTLAVSLVQTGIGVSFSRPPGTPAHGPPYIAWNQYLFSFSYTDLQSFDHYYSVALGQANGAVLIGADDSVSVSGPYATSGSYLPQPNHQFNFNGDPNMAYFFALNSCGNPFPNELPGGITVIYGANIQPPQIIGGDGTLYSFSYNYGRPNGTWAWKFTALLNQVYLAQDANGGFTSPPYVFSGADETFNESPGWPDTNLYPQHLYVNGLICTLNPASETDSGGDPTTGTIRTGSASYTVGNDFTVTLSWTWNSGSTPPFSAQIQISYGTVGGTYAGTWDGLSTFGGLPAGFTASVTAPSGSPHYGPPQINYNGVAYTYSGNTSQGANVYSNPFGQSTITIGAGGAVTITKRNGTTFTGTYNASTGQFSFGDQNVGTIAAADSAGQTLSTLINGGATTTINGGLDVQGNSFTLGTWMNGSESIYGLSLGYADAASPAASTLGLTTTRSAVNWFWTHPSTDGGTDSLISMELDNAHRLLIYSPTAQSQPAVTIDPVVGVSSVVPVRVLPAGDINMGNFTNGPVPGGQ
jgi:hypothetical protein